MDGCSLTFHNNKVQAATDIPLILLYLFESSTAGKSARYNCPQHNTLYYTQYTFRGTHLIHNPGPTPKTGP